MPTALTLGDTHALADSLGVSDGLRDVLIDTHDDAVPDTLCVTHDESLAVASDDALTVINGLTDSDRVNDVVTDAVEIEDVSGVSVAIDCVGVAVLTSDACGDKLPHGDADAH